MTIQNINFAKYAGKTDGSSTLTANEWNTIMSELDTVVDAIPESSSQSAGGSDSGIVSAEVDPSDADKTIVKVNDVTVGELTVKGQKGTNVTLSGNNNINIEPRPAAGTGEDKNTPGLANRKGGNISLKPGDDIELCSHKRGTGKNTEVAVKVIDGSENPVKLQVFAGDITLSTKGKGSTKTKDANGADTQELLYDDPNVMNVNVTTGNGKGYLKVRAQAIDLRCEDHGGIALQPKGNDGDGHENKIKFEHGGGDGLEFGTFNTDKTSIFTRQYRFNKNGVWKMATRQTETSDKADADDSTTARKYVKQSDDFYDIISNNDRTATTEQIITAGSMVTTFADSDQVMICDVKNDLYTVKSVDLEELQMEPDFVIDSEVHTNLPTVGNNLSPEDAKIYAITDKLSSSELDQFELMLLDPRVPIIVKYTTISDSVNGEGNLSFQISRSVADITLYGGGASNGETNDVKVSDIAKLVAYMKSNHQGPWAN